jgi:hypothetical protein
MLCEKCGISISENETFCGRCEKAMQARRNKLSAANSSVDSRQFYAHSGKIAPQLVLGVPILLIISTLLAFAYAYSVIYIPIVGYLSFLLTLGFALGVGFCTAIVLQFFKTRNSLFAFCFGLGAGIFALYAAWVTFEYVLWNRDATESIELVRLAFNPLVVWRVACLIAEKGWYSIRNTTPAGAVLWSFWGVEACVVVGISAYMSRSFIKDSVFCEACKGWTEDHKNKLAFEFADESELKGKLTNQDLSFLKDIIKVKSTQESFYRIDCSVCSTCDNLYTLSLLRISRTWDKEGKETEKAKAVLKNLFISKETFAQLTGKKQAPKVEKTVE